LVRAYEILWVIYAVVAAAVLILTDLAFAAVVVMCLLGIALVFAGMMDVLPEIVENL
jgi:uncharacterized membrane protein HdeD (DUF308 family)